MFHPKILHKYFIQTHKARNSSYLNDSELQTRIAHYYMILDSEVNGINQSMEEHSEMELLGEEERKERQERNTTVGYRDPTHQQ